MVRYRKYLLCSRREITWPSDPIWAARAEAWRTVVDDLITNGAPCSLLAGDEQLDRGHSHMMMMDANNALVLAACQSAIAFHGKKMR